MSRDAIVVLGMHRSGTSALTGALNLLGIPAGKSLLEANQHNPKGFFENTYIIDLNDEILNLYNHTWDTQFLLPENWHLDDELAIFKKRALDLLMEDFPPEGLFAMKDPRLSLLLPFWKTVFQEAGIRPHYIIVLRHPLEVHKSLSLRAFCSREKALILWTNYMFSIEKYTRDAPRIVISYAEFVKDPVHSLSMIDEQFSIGLQLNKDNIKEKVRDFVEGNLKHHNNNQAEATKLPPLVERLYSVFSRLASEKSNHAGILQEVNQCREAYHKQASLFHNHEILVKKGVKEFSLANDRAMNFHILEKLKNGGRKDSRDGAFDTQSKLDDPEMIARHWQIEVVEKAEKSHAFQQAIDAQQRSIRSLNQELQTKKYAIQNLQEELKKLRYDITGIRQSVSFRLGWILTAPFRWLFRLIFPSSTGTGQLIFQIVAFGLQRPFALARHINKSNFRKLKWAIRSESPHMIYRNFINLITGDPSRVIIVQDAGTGSQLKAPRTYANPEEEVLVKSEKITKGPTSGSVLFVSHDTKLAGAQMALLNILEWFARHTALEIKLISLGKGSLLKRFQSICPTIIWEDVVHQMPAFSARSSFLGQWAGKVDLIYGNTCLSPEIYPELAFLNAPYITHVHELEKSIKKYIPKNVLNNMHIYTDAYIACSRPVAKNLEKRHLRDGQAVQVIHEFINRYPKTDEVIDKAKQRAWLELEQDKFLVVGCGTIYWRKGFDLFVESAIHLLNLGFLDFHFYWIGDNGWDAYSSQEEFGSWKQITTRMKETGIDKHITLLGTRANPRDYFLACDVFYLPSREDPFPLACLEAAECMLPIICFSGAGGIPDFVGFDAGFAVEYENARAAADKIKFLLVNPEKRSEMGAMAREKLILRHTIDNTAPTILEMIRSYSNVKPAISVLLPNYDSGKYLAERLSSILSQNFKDIEIILFNDVSSDNSRALIETYRNNPFIRLELNEVNSGIEFEQWRKGIAKARGEIIWVAEAKDSCREEMLARLYPYFAVKDVRLAYANSTIIEEDGVITGDFDDYYAPLDTNHWSQDHISPIQKEVLSGLGIMNTIPNASAVLFRRQYLSDAVLENASKFQLCGNWWIFLQICDGGKIAYTTDKLNMSRKLPSSDKTEPHSEEYKRLFLQETYRTHTYILENFFTDEEYTRRWDRYISHQIKTLYPEGVKADLDKYYPVGLIRKELEERQEKIENSLDKILIVTHDANFTGAPQIILKVTELLRNTYQLSCTIVSLKGGPLMDEFAKHGDAHLVYQGNTINASELHKILHQSSFDYALVNTACCAEVMMEIKKHQIPIACLIHDYTYPWSENYLKTLYENADQIIYPVQFMVDTNLKDYPFDLNKTSIIPQGLYKEDLLHRDLRSERRITRRQLGIPENAFVVFGCGSINPRKGVDIFINTAIQALDRHKEVDRPLYFLWLGGKLEKDSKDAYSRFLQRDLVHSGFADRILFVGVQKDVEVFYGASDLFFLSSREDPFPTVVLEAFASGNPVVAIEGSTGSGELIKHCQNFLVPYAQRGEIASLICRLSSDPDLLKEVANRGKEVVAREYRYADYVRKILNLMKSNLPV